MCDETHHKGLHLHPSFPLPASEVYCSRMEFFFHLRSWSHHVANLVPQIASIFYRLAICVSWLEHAVISLCFYVNAIVSPAPIGGILRGVLKAWLSLVASSRRLRRKIVSVVLIGGERRERDALPPCSVAFLRSLAKDVDEMTSFLQLC